MCAGAGEAPVLEIDLAAIQANYRYMRTLAAPRVVTAAVVKCDAYGLGLTPVARALMQAGCSYFFVADLDEAVRLRLACPQASIAVLHDDLAACAAAYERQGFLPVVNDSDALRMIRLHLPALRFILNVDTGLARLGLSRDQVTRLYLERAFERLPLVGVMSHLACSAHSTAPENERQRRRFASLSRLLQPCWASLAASSGMWLGRRYHFDLTRPGSALYGLCDPRIRPTPLRPVVRLSAPVVDVRPLCPGEAVGYGASFRARRPSRVATVGIGYRHGLPWRGADRLTARIGAQSVPVIGRLSMGYLAVDATDLSDERCHPGARVDLLDDRLSLDELADAAGTAAQPILLRLGAACRRRYLPADACDPPDAVQPDSPVQRC